MPPMKNGYLRFMYCFGAYFQVECILHIVIHAQRNEGLGDSKASAMIPSRTQMG
ncbi:hypothetical protein ARMGADRAFT_677194 [Armillaria gallica]|uniref:Uncharacterized protein n=1 Tax=Armillaria gallica TaxID=47427 RepID=A0A2H3CVM3_ARMGA|nr:hypothetical protein ARMGADRAFT_677194 [Armillaria gallica]